MPNSSRALSHCFAPLTILSLACGGGNAGSEVATEPAVVQGSLDGTSDPAATLGDELEGVAPCSTAPADKATRPRAAAGGWAPSAGTAAAQTCGPTIAADTFTSALCSCEDTNVVGYLRTRSFRSDAGEQTPERLGGSVGVNRSYVTGGWADVGGSFAVSGRRDVIFGGLLQVGEDLRFNPSLDVAGIVQVGRDAALAGALRAVGFIDITRDLYQAASSRFLGLAFVDVGGQRLTEDVAVPPPCACGADQVLDISALVAEARTNNDNASVGLEAHELDLVAGIGTVLTLPSGRYHLHQIAGAGALRLRIGGKVALFVDDDFYAGPLFRVSLDPGAELDLFVEDNLVLAGAALLGDPGRPSATRVYAGGTGDIAVAGLTAFAGNVYAPNANIFVGGVGRVFGSLFGRNILSAGVLDVGYDESIRDGEVACPPDGGGDPDDGPSPGGDPGGGDGGAGPGGGDPNGGEPGDGDGDPEPPHAGGGGGTPEGEPGGGPDDGAPGGGSGTPPCGPSAAPTVY